MRPANNFKSEVDLSVSLFALSFSSHSRILNSYGDVTITGEGPLTYDLPMFALVAIKQYSYCDTGHPFIMIISEDP